MAVLTGWQPTEDTAVLWFSGGFSVSFGLIFHVVFIIMNHMLCFGKLHLNFWH